MTAEIAVMNKEAVALAADSAVSGPKIFTSANKIFALSKYSPVAVMVYDSAHFLGVPWETVIKAYRAELGTRTFPTLRVQAAHFLGFFDRCNRLFPHQVQQAANGALFESFFDAVLERIDQLLDARMSEGEELTEAQIAEQGDEVIGPAHAHWTGASRAASLPEGHEEAVLSAYEEALNQAIDRAFGDFPLTDVARGQLVEMGACLVSKETSNPLSPYHSGVVIAGFGSEDHFPRLFEFELETIALGRLKYVQTSATEIGEEDGSAVISAFAQREQVATFMQGMDEGLTGAMAVHWQHALPKLIERAADRLKLKGKARSAFLADMDADYEGFLNEYDEELRDLQHELYVYPIIRVVAMMPKDELAAMAESLVNLTSFKRKVTDQAETVGGPIDVAVISKGDGLVWIKRKHYFDPELNPQFFANYYRKEPDGR